jgi:hypothetical protein
MNFGPIFVRLALNSLINRILTTLHRKVDSAWESDFMQRKAYYLQI